MLSLLVFFPALFGALLLPLPGRLMQKAALAGALLQLALSCSLFFLFEPEAAHLQLVEKAPLIPFLGVRYFLGIDGISFWYIQLSAFLLPMAVLSSRQISRPSYYFFLFSLVSLANGVFLSFDGVLFYLFFEMSLLPLFFLIYLYGGRERVYASFKFLIYTFFASLFLLAGLAALMLMSKHSLGAMSASLLDFYQLDLVFVEGRPLSSQSLLFFCFAIAFAVKTPVFPFHTWLPLAHVEAPAAASAFLAAVVLKMGTYGWFRLVLPLFPEAAAHYSPILLFLAAFGLIFASLAAFAQSDMKKLAAYSSVAHMAYVLLGVFAFNIYGLMGGFYQTLTHAVSSAALFFLIGALYERSKTRVISDYGGLARIMPRMAVIFFLVAMSAIALPLTGGFVSEFLALLGSYMSGKIWVWPAAAGVILSAAYMLRLFGGVFFSRETRITKNMKDLNFREMAFLAPFAVLTLVMGLYPQIFFKYSRASLRHLSGSFYSYQLSEGSPSEESPKTFPEEAQEELRQQRQKKTQNGDQEGAGNKSNAGAEASKRPRQALPKAEKASGDSLPDGYSRGAGLPDDSGKAPKEPLKESPKESGESKAKPSAAGLSPMGGSQNRGAL